MNHSPSPSTVELIILSGLSGAGKTVALKTFEDLGFYCSDNLPIRLLPTFVTSVLGSHSTRRIVVGIDSRTQLDHHGLEHWRSVAQQHGIHVQLLFFDADQDALLRRYADTRRRHPLSQSGLSLPQAIAHEREITQPIREQADSIIDTSTMNVHQLRRYITIHFALASHTALSLLFESFSYRKGVPTEADFVFDARVLPNPHWQEALRPLTGRDRPVRDYLDAQTDVQRYVDQITPLLDTWLPRLRGESRSYVTIAFGCTGGKHRSVYLAERLAAHAREQGWTEVATFHREQE